MRHRSLHQESSAAISNGNSSAPSTPFHPQHPGQLRLQREPRQRQEEGNSPGMPGRAVERGWPGFGGGWREGEMEKQPHPGALFASGCSNITCHERPWESLLELVLFADYTNGPFVLLICA